MGVDGPHRLDPAGIRGCPESCVFISAIQRHSLQRAIGFERPGMIGAAEKGAGIASPVNGDFRSFVRAAIVQDLDLAIRMAHLNDRLGADLCREVITVFRGLAVMADKDLSLLLLICERGLAL